MATKKGLGRGLGALLDANSVIETTTETEKDVKKIKITQIEPNKTQPRCDFDEEKLEELSESIKEYGLLQPIVVKLNKNGFYTIIAGERRWRASRLAGLKEIPAVIKDVSEQTEKEITLIENIQRENLNPIEEAIAFKRLLTEFHLKQDEVAERVSKSRTAVTNSMRLLKLDERVQQMVIEEKISTGHARALLGIEDGEVQYVTACKVFDESLSVREVEKLVKAMNQPKKEQKKPEINLAIYESISEQLKQLMGTKVNVLPKNENKGKIEIEYYSTEELERIIDLFMSTK